VRLTVGETTLTQSFAIRKDPRVEASDDDLRAQFALLLKIRDKLSETNDAINQLRSLRSQIEDWEKRSQGRKDNEAIAEAAKAMKEGLAAVEAELVQTSWKSSRDALTAPSKLNAKLATLGNVVGGSDAAPTTQAQEVFATLSERLDAQFERLETLIRRDVPRFNALVQEQNLPALTVREPSEET
jgi:phage-related tail protein